MIRYEYWSRSGKIANVHNFVAINFGAIFELERIRHVQFSAERYFIFLNVIKWSPATLAIISSFVCTYMTSTFRLDEDRCLTLEQILGTFTTPITEQHAWAITYQVNTPSSLLLFHSFILFLPFPPSFHLEIKGRGDELNIKYSGYCLVMIFAQWNPSSYIVNSRGEIFKQIGTGPIPWKA